MPASPLSYCKVFTLSECSVSCCVSSTCPQLLFLLYLWILPSPHHHRHSGLSTPRERDPLTHNSCSPEPGLCWVLIALHGTEDTRCQYIPALQECLVTIDTRPQEMPHEIKVGGKRSRGWLICLGCAEFWVRSTSLGLLCSDSPISNDNPKPPMATRAVSL